LALDHTLIQIRERSYVDLLDLALVVIRNRPRAIGLAALAGALPFMALNWWLPRQLELPLAALLCLLPLETAWATAPLTIVLGDEMFGVRPTVRSVSRRLARAFPAMLASQLISRGFLWISVLLYPSAPGVSVFTLVAAGVLYPLVPSRLGFLNEVVLLEHGKIPGIVKRCSALTGDRGGEFFGHWLVQILIGVAFAILFWFGVGSLLRALTTPQLTWDEPGVHDLNGLGFQCGVWLAIAFFGVVRFLAYIDQRIRLEGWEVKLRLQAVGLALEETAP
jgi:hypothetical protein